MEISGLPRGFSTCCLRFTSGVATTHARLASGGQARLYRKGNLAPGVRAPSDMAPVIAFRDGRPVAAVASVGSSLHPETVRIVAGLLDGRRPAELAVAPPLLLNLAALT
jgi:gamma-glutamyltranspeptidase